MVTMLRTRCLAPVTALLVVLACDRPQPLAPPSDVAPAPLAADLRLPGFTSGHGTYVVSGFEARFSHGAVALPRGKAAGAFRHTLDFNGQLVDFIGLVTCVTFDEANRRAWIGGVILRNNSEHPSFTTPLHAQGKDIWFRVVDYGNGDVQPDRTTFVGFEGSAGFITSAEYCAGQPWPDNDDRTNAVTGNILVHP
jgi:hypothetical protein